MVLTDSRSGSYDVTDDVITYNHCHAFPAILVRIGQYIIDTKRATSQASLPVSFTEVLVSFKRSALLRYLHRLILASEPRHLPACFVS